MLVRDCMTRDPISVRPESDPLAAVALLKSARIRRLPVVDADGHVVGIVTQNNLEIFLSKAPSPGIMKRQHKVEQVMTTPVITVSPDHPLEEAARLMIERKISCLPVVENDRLVGVITDTDIFRQFVNLLGGQAEAVRITLVIPDVRGQLAKIAAAIANIGGNIRSVIIYRTAQSECDCNVSVWVQDVARETLETTLRNLPDVRVLYSWSESRRSDS